MKTVRNKIKRNDIIRNYTSKKALVPPPEVHVRIADADVVNYLDNAVAVVLYELGVFCARRKMEVHNFVTNNVSYEKNRTIGTELKPRVSLNLLSNKEDSTGEIRDRSLHGNRETVFSCRCPGSHNKDNTSANCPMTAFSTLWRHRTDLYLREKEKFKPKNLFATWWSNVKLMLRMKWDDNGIACGFYAGGPSCRGMSLANINKFYQKALQLGGMNKDESKKYSFHGAKRAHVTFAKNYGGASDGDVVLGTKHAHGGTVKHYNDASRAQLSRPAIFQGELRDRMRAVIAFKENQKKSGDQREIPTTPPKVPGEVNRSREAISPTEVQRLQQFLDSKGIGTNELREVEAIKPGASAQVLEMATQLSLGNNIKRPRFGIMGSLVNKLGLFEKTNCDSISNASKTQNIYQAPVQVFNGPVYFGGSPQSFLQGEMNKRHLEMPQNQNPPKLPKIESKEDFFD